MSFCNQLCFKQVNQAQEETLPEAKPEKPAEVKKPARPQTALQVGLDSTMRKTDIHKFAKMVGLLFAFCYVLMPSYY